MVKVNNPAKGSELGIAAGDSLQLIFPVMNDAPVPVSYSPQISRLPEEWVQTEEVVAPPSGDAEIAINITIPYEASQRSLDFRVVVLKEGDPDPQFAGLDFVLRINAPTGPPPKSETNERPAVVAQVPEVEVVPPPKPPRTRAKPAVQPTEEPVRPKAQSSVDPSIAEPTAPKPPPPPPINVSQRPVEATPASTPPAAETPAPQVKTEPPIVDTGWEKAQTKPKVWVDPLKGVEYDRETRNPGNGYTLNMRPGQKLLITFEFENTERTAQTYLLEAGSGFAGVLPQGWLTFPRDRVNITPLGMSTMYALISVSLNASPGERKFSLKVGSERSQKLDERVLKLQVACTPAVALVTQLGEKTDVKADKTVWFSGQADYSLRLDNAGNSVTAARVAVRAEEKAQKSAKSAPKDVYAREDWTYHFDNELLDLEQPDQNDANKSQPVRLRLKRNGTWWWGWQEKHTCTAYAIPVTDRSNGGKGNNAVTLSMTRRRIFPVPWFIAAPVLAVFFTLFLEPTPALRVSNAYPQSGQSSVDFVIGSKDSPTSKSITSRFSWEKTHFWNPQVLQRVDNNNTQATSGGDVDTVDIGGTDYVRQTTYQLGKRFGFGKSVSRQVYLVPWSTDGDLQVSVDDQKPTPQQDTISVGEGENKVTISVVTYEVTIRPGQGALIRLHNSHKGDEVKLMALLSAKPGGVTFGGRGTINTAAVGNKTEIKWKRPIDEWDKIDMNLANGVDEETVEFVTTDKQAQILRFHLKREGNN